MVLRSKRPYPFFFLSGLLSYRSNTECQANKERKSREGGKKEET
jgi:hypothetical protein